MMSTPFAHDGLLTRIVLPTGQLRDEQPTYGVLGRRRLMDHGIAYGSKNLWQRNCRSSRGSNAPPGRPGKLAAGRRAAGSVIDKQKDYAQCKMPILS